MIQEQEFTCQFTDPVAVTDPEQVCTAENICDNDPEISSWAVDWNSKKSLYNWQQKLDLMCRPGWQVGALGSVYFIGYVLTLLWLPKLADIHGRKELFTWGMVAQTICFTVIMFTKQYYVMIAAIFGFGFLASIRQVTGFIYFLELLPVKNRIATAVIFTLIDGLTYQFVVIYFWFISKHWFWLILFAYCMQITGAILSWFLPESPVYLLELERRQETVEVFKSIAKFNRAEESFNCASVDFCGS